MIFKIKDGYLELIENFLDKEEADRLFDLFLKTIPWKKGNIKIFGKQHLKPRLESFHAEDNVAYSYSGNKLITENFNPDLSEIKERIENQCSRQFNSVLINLYQDGKHSNGWHSDNEKELGIEPFIASLSLGETRIFKLKHQDGDTLDIPLKDGSLLLMGGQLQHKWKHCIPKSSKILGPRINLTYRNIKI
jgi:alkylated DNA repair dioxygenase AlkB